MLLSINKPGEIGLMVIEVSSVHTGPKSSFKTVKINTCQLSIFYTMNLQSYYKYVLFNEFLFNTAQGAPFENKVRLVT